MPIFLTTIDHIALAVYMVYFGGILGGIWLLWRSSGKGRMWGVMLLFESLAAVVLLTLMSSRYWITGGKGIIDIGLRPLFEALTGIFAPLGIGIAIIATVIYLVIKLMQGRYKIIGFLLPCLLIPILFILSAWQLIVLTENNKPKIAELEKKLKIVPGFTINAFISEPVLNPTSMVFGPDNNLYVANYNGEIWGISLVDSTSWLYAKGFQVPVGLAWHENSLYIASQGKISVTRDTDGDKVADSFSDIIRGLPARLYPWHANNGIIFGSDGRIYFAVGSTSDSSPETSKYAATILSAEADGSDLRTFATGVRNPYRLALNSKDDLFATDNGPDTFAVTPGDELNQIVEGGNYGFPKYFAYPPPGSATLAPIALFPPHASADGLAFYQGDQFPPEYYDNAFVTLWHLGEIDRIQLTKDANGNYASRISVFVTGLHSPLDVAIGPDGSLYVGDFSTSIIYKISFVGRP